MVTAGSLPIAREVAVNTITGPSAGGVSLGPLSEGPGWHSPWAGMVSPLQKKENSKQVELSSSPKSVYPMNFLSKTQKHRVLFTSKVAEATKASGSRAAHFTPASTVCFLLSSWEQHEEIAPRVRQHQGLQGARSNGRPGSEQRNGGLKSTRLRDGADSQVNNRVSRGTWSHMPHPSVGT